MPRIGDNPLTAKQWTELRIALHDAIAWTDSLTDANIGDAAMAARYKSEAKRRRAILKKLFGDTYTMHDPEYFRRRFPDAKSVSVFKRIKQEK